ncbi:MAG: tetratricopeptide repeat protein [Armatimonadota bacterium]|nr:tetratricopeptide repeat protein [Armatimonadota bacterium]
MKFERRIHLLAGLLLALATFLVFCRVLSHDFINFDDGVYVYSNANIKELTFQSIRWAFKTMQASNWHPLTWISHIIDYQLFGLKPAGHHFTSLLLHITNSLLLLYILNRMSGSFWRSIFVAALFALHPLHVESVAWVAERKDVLSTLFWMLTIWAYLRYVQSPKIKTYIPVILLFSLGLMSKPMLVTLPFVLLLLDYWPLCRTTFSRRHSQVAFPIGFKKLLLEKTPLFFLSAISCAITYIVQQKSGAVVPSERLPFGIRLENAIVSYLAYIFKMVWPAKLAIFYPHPMAGLPIWQVLGTSAILIIASILAIIVLKKYPYICVGWFWYLGTLIPVIGLVQVGTQAMADRYTYIPLIGIFIIIAWGIPDLIARLEEHRISRITTRRIYSSRLRLSFLQFIACISIIAFSICTWSQLGYWKNSITIFHRTIAVTGENSVAQYNLGVAFANQNKPALALAHFEEAVRIDPFNFYARYNLGKALDETGRYSEAEEQFRAAILLNPNDADSHNNLACVLLEQGRYDEAIAEYKEALRLKPNDSVIRNNMVSALIKRGDLSEALKQYAKALKINPNDPFAHYNMGNMMVKQQKWNEAIRHFSEAVRLKPNYADAYYNLGVTYQTIGKLDKAYQAYQHAIRSKPGFGKPHNNMAVILYMRGDYAGAWREVELYIKSGGRPHPGFINALSEKMPKPPN